MSLNKIVIEFHSRSWAPLYKRGIPLLEISIENAVRDIINNMSYLENDVIKLAMSQTSHPLFPSSEIKA